MERDQGPDDRAHDIADARQAERTGFIVRLMFGLELLVVALAFLDANNDPLVTALVHGPSLMVVGLGIWFHANGRARAAGWIASSVFWLVVASSTWFFGGLRFEMGTAYVVSIMIAAATLGSRPALFFGALSALAATAVTAADLLGVLPPSAAPDSPINGWIAVTISVGIAAALVHIIMRDLQLAAQRAVEAASERDAARIRFLEAQKMEPVGRLASGVAHDFNNLLTVMRGVGEMLRDRNIDAATQVQLLDDLESAVARAAQMTGQLLAFGKRGHGDPSAVDLSRLVDDLGPLLGRLVGDDIELVVRTDAGRGSFVQAAPGHLEQIVLNLAVNARDAMPSGGKLSLSTIRRSEQRVELVVEDTGVGMAADLVEQVFSPFFTTKPSGTGLGLATVADIVAVMEGTVEIDTEPGRGTRFRISFPECAPPATAVSPRRVSEARTVEHRRILLVDDHELVLGSTKRLLERAGYEVVTAPDGAAALERFDREKTPFDAIVSDMMMPKVGGVELVTKLRARGFDRPIVLVSGNVEGIPDAFEADPELFFLAKPFQGAELLVVLDRMMNARTVHPALLG